MNETTQATRDGARAVRAELPMHRRIGVVATAACALAFTILHACAALADTRSWRQGNGFRYADLGKPIGQKPGFVTVASEETGILFTNMLASARSLTNHVLLNGSGVAAGDVDGDGLCDLYFCGLDGPNRLYRHLGNWRFEDITGPAGVACPSIDATGAAFADADGDGDLDLLVNSIGKGSLLFLNDGRGRFEDATRLAGLDGLSGSMSLALADVDGDGDLDLYVANYRTWTMRDSFSMRIKVSMAKGKPIVTMVNGRPVTDPDLVGRVSIDGKGNIEENGEADALYLNDGRGHFSRQSFLEGRFLDEDGKKLRTPPYDWSLSAMFRDLNGDGAPDLYVCGDLGSPDRIWINDRSGRFRAAPRVALRKTSWFSMGMDFADINRDGLDDFLVTDMVSRSHAMRQVQVSNHHPVFSPIGQIENRPQIPRNTLFLNVGGGEYAEAAYFSGLDATEWSWGPVFLDVDLDGFEDVLIVTGFERDVQDIDVANQLEAIRRQRKLPDHEALQMRARFPKLNLPKLAFRNRGDLTFEEVSAAWGFNSRAISQGIALADLDNDGDLDAAVNDMNGPAEVFRNRTGASRIAVRLKGEPPNTRGIGANIQVFDGAVPVQSQQMIAGGRYLSADENLRVFACGLSSEMRLEVDWRSGKRSVVPGVLANRIYEIDEAAAKANPLAKHQARSEAAIAAPEPWFEDVSHLLNHSHHDEEFDDFARQKLLPKRLNQLGPGVAWADVDGDGRDDLVIGSGKGGQLAVYRNDGQGGFERLGWPVLSQAVTRDQTTVLVAPKGEGSVILAGSANYEDGLATGSAVRQYDLVAGKMDDSLPGSLSSTGPLALADIDGDGDLDLFVGGRVIPGRYPEAASSRLFRNQDGRFVLDTETSRKFEGIGLTSGAVFTDLDGDGFPELALACEWGPIRLFRGDRGAAFRQITGETGLDGYQGWWNGVTAGDFDGDGQMDLAASNWGLNTKYEAYRGEPLRLYYGDFEGSGGVDLIEAYHEPGMRKIVPWQHLGRVGPALPFVGARFSTFAQFARASVSEILGERFGSAREVRAQWLQTTVFLNRGPSFEAIPLPSLAQLSPAFALSVGDADGDGKEDLFLSQNFFGTEAETGRYDSGCGLWLKGDGNGGFTPVLPSRSGVRVYGEQRGAALADYDGDGRVDLVIAQNAAPTRLFRNAAARPGLRVKLRGPVDNPSGIGARVRLAAGGRLGPAREIHAGAGYWSQDSAMVVLGAPERADEVWVCWPGGATFNLSVPTGARMVGVDMNGNLRRIE